MRPTDQTLMQQIKITNREITRRLEYLNISKKDLESLIQSKAVIAPKVDLIVKDFYDYLIRYDEIARIIGDSESLTRLKNFIRRYILELFDGDYDAEYVQTRLRIGLVHKRIGVSPKLYIMAVNHLLNLLRNQLMGSVQNDCRKCKDQVAYIEKIILFDLTLVFDTYIHGLMDELVRGKEELELYTANLEEIISERTRELSEMARTDGLTNLFNQKIFYEELRRESSRARRVGEELSLIYIDLDGFKGVNDSLGHRKGDEILVDVAGLIRSAVREEDITARYGGDEFCVILPNTGSDQAETTANRIISLFKEKMSDSFVTLSIGISTSRRNSPLDSETLVKKADAAMYKSKKIKGQAVTKEQ